VPSMHSRRQSLQASPPPPSPALPSESPSPCSSPGGDHTTTCPSRPPETKFSPPAPACVHACIRVSARACVRACARGHGRRAAAQAHRWAQDRMEPTEAGASNHAAEGGLSL
jgi:hypothetical protein